MGMDETWKGNMKEGKGWRKEEEVSERTLDNKMKRAEVTGSKWVQSGHGVEEES